MSRTITIHGVTHELKPACDVGHVSGHWGCADCGINFANNLQVSLHESEHPGHTMAWCCHECDEWQVGQ